MQCVGPCPYVHELLLVGLLGILPVAHCCTSPRTSREFHPPHCLLYRGRWSPMPAWVLWRRRLSGRGPCRSFQLWGSRLCNPLALWWAHAPKHENGDRPIFVWVVSERPLCALERSRCVLRKGCTSHAAGLIILFSPPRFWHLWQFFQSFPPPSNHHHPPPPTRPWSSSPCPGCVVSLPPWSSTARRSPPPRSAAPGAWRSGCWRSCGSSAWSLRRWTTRRWPRSWRRAPPGALGPWCRWRWDDWCWGKKREKRGKMGELGDGLL